jgi:predicted nucleic acid-binding protein
LEITALEFDRTRQWIAAFESPLRTLDALHLACAFNHDLTLYSVDRNLIRSAKQFGVKHRAIS